MPTPEARYVFGPVPSRRLGRSLGVDLVPFKTCTYDCVYCQLGRTTERTLERTEYVPVEDVLSELRRSLASGPPPDYVTLSGSGEPTLHSGLEALIRGIKRLTATPVAVLTNGSLLSDREVRRGLREADLVIPSLDAGDEELFCRVNRPHPGLSLSRVVEGLCSFRRDFRNQMWLEVFLLAGVSDAPPDVEAVARAVRDVHPDRIQLNTVDRPPAEPWARPVPGEALRSLAERFVPRAEVVAGFQPSMPAGEKDVAATEILRLLARRPCTAEDVAEGLGLHLSEAVKHLALLEAYGMAEVVYLGGRCFHLAAFHPDSSQGTLP